jgi:CheY-like chemotaxis protein
LHLDGKLVLVADDNYINREILTGLLRKSGVESEQVGDGAQAVAAAMRGKFDAILLDISMPGMGGIEAMAEIRKKLGHAAPPIIAVTANTMSHQIDEYLRAGFDAHLGKPFRRQDLEAVLVHLLQDSGPAKSTDCA